MRSRVLLFAMLGAAALLGTVVTDASARNLSFNELGFRIVWVELNFTEPIFRIGVHCPVTLEGSFHSRTAAKTIGALAGFVTRAVINSAACRGGHASILTETLPWHSTYEGFTGTLPRITGVRFLLGEADFRMEIPAVGINCLARAVNDMGTVTGSLEAGGALKEERLTPGQESIFCGSIRGVFEGVGTVTKLGLTERILVSLI